MSGDGSRLACTVCKVTCAKGWAIPQSRLAGKRTTAWSGLLRNLSKHVSNVGEGKHQVLLRQQGSQQRESAKVADRVGYNLVQIVYSNITLGVSYR